MLLYVVSPAKTLDLETPVPRAIEQRATEPLFLDDAAKLATTMRRKSARQVAALMDLSPALSELNVQRYRDYAPGEGVPGSRPALRTFNGDVYDGLDAATLSTADVDFAQRHLVILSGLYGVLRPLDLIQPYRLEMGTALKNKRGKDLYAFWGDRITEAINEAASGMKKPVIVNLASQEYFKAVNVGKLKYPLITPEFKEWKSGGYKVIGLFAKKARGMMTDYAIKERITDIRELKHFSTEGYRFDESLSDAASWVFTRKA